MTDTILRKTIFLRAEREEVWAFLTEPEKLAKWFHAPKATLREGGELALYGAKSGDKVIWGEVIAARAPEYLEYSFTVAPMNGATSLVKWHLTSVEGGTRLSLEHEGLPSGSDAFDLILALDNGWDKHFMQMREALHPVPA